MLNEKKDLCPNCQEKMGHAYLSYGQKYQSYYKDGTKQLLIKCGEQDLDISYCKNCCHISFGVKDVVE